MRHHPIDDTKADHIANRAARMSGVNSKASVANHTGRAPSEIHRSIEADIQDYYNQKGPEVNPEDIYKGQIYRSWTGLDPLKLDEFHEDPDRLAEYIGETTGGDREEIQLSLRRYREEAFDRL